LIAMLVLLIAGITPVKSSAAPAAQSTSLMGLLGVTWGDPQQGEGLPPRLDLYATDGSAYQLSVDPALVAAAGGLFANNGAQVIVEGEFDVAALDQNGNPVLNVSALMPTGEASALATLSGPQPWVILMCQFSDIGAEPHNQAYFQGLFGASFPGINDFWQRVSYGGVNLNGTTVIPDWVRLPQPRSHYVGNGVNLQALTNDCTGLVDNSINFAQFAGVGMMFNGELDGSSWGGTTFLNRDGVNIIRAAWMPVWGYENQHVMAHEVGHGLGLPHSSGPYNQTYDSPWDVMSGWPANCAPGTYGCVAVETISYHRNLLGWIPSSRIYTAAQASNREITLERLGQPTNPPGSYLFAKIPINGSSTRYYTVEARRYIDAIQYNDYEEGLMGQAVVIHLVDTSRSDRFARLVDGDNDGDPRDAGTRWMPGEEFFDGANSITIRVEAATNTGYTVSIHNGNLPNDNFGSPTTISSYPFSRYYDTSTATSQGSDPVFPCASTRGAASVWYKITPSSRGRASVSTVGSDYDTLLGVWRGSSGALTNIGCDDNGGGNGASALTTVLSANTTYYIEIAGKSGSGNLNFSLDFTPCYRLSKSVSPSGWGSISAQPTPNCTANSYLRGTSVQLSAAPAADRVFSGWGGALSGSSNPAAISMTGNKTLTANFLPIAPTPISPTGGVTVPSRRPTLDWTDVSGATYRVQISRYSDFSSPLTYNPSASSVRPSVNLASNTRYYWRVRATVGGTYSAWTAPNTFWTPNPPTVPGLLTPANGATVTSTRPTLDWRDSSNAPAGYQVQVSTSSSFASPMLNATPTNSSYSINPPLSSNSRYYWRVRAFNASGHYSGWSSVFSFFTPP
jgi:M6 family metalloprotease-like protein